MPRRWSTRVQQNASVTTGLYVVGVGRSGTSVATRICATLGLRLPHATDIIPADSGNPTGYWESNSLTGLNDRLLARLGGTWWQPPPGLDEYSLAGLDDEVERAAEAFHDSFGETGGWVWKDPRLTVLLPFWERVNGPGPVLVPFRQPQAVARSIAARDGLTYGQCLGIWSTHTRLMIKMLAGRPVLFSAYEELVGDPRKWSEQLRSFCHEAGLTGLSAPEPLDLLSHRLVPPRSDSDGPLGEEQQQLADIVRDLAGAHARFPDVALPPPSREPTGNVSPRRRYPVESPARRPGSDAGRPANRAGPRRVRLRPTRRPRTWRARRFRGAPTACARRRGAVRRSTR